MKSIIFLLLMGCSLGQIDRRTTSRKDLLSEETLLRYNSTIIGQLTNSSDKKLAALAKCHSGNIKEGLEQLKNNYNTLKNDFDYWNKIGTCYYIDNNLPKASFYFQHSLSLSKDRKSKAFSFNNLGVVLLKQKHYEQSFDMFSKANQLNPRLITPRFNLAQLHIQFGQIQQAKNLLMKLYKLESNDIDILSSLAVIALIDQNYVQAIHFYKSIDEKNFKRSDIAGYYALALYKIGKFNEAKELLKQQDISTEKAFYKLNRKLTLMIKTAIKRQEKLGNSSKESI